MYYAPYLVVISVFQGFNGKILSIETSHTLLSVASLMVYVQYVYICIILFCKFPLYLLFGLYTSLLFMLHLLLILFTYVFVTGFWKTDLIVTHEINRISMFMLM